MKLLPDVKWLWSAVVVAGSMQGMGQFGGQVFGQTPPAGSGQNPQYQPQYQNAQGQPQQGPQQYAPNNYQPPVYQPQQGGYQQQPNQPANPNDQQRVPPAVYGPQPPVYSGQPGMQQNPQAGNQPPIYNPATGTMQRQPAGPMQTGQTQPVPQPPFVLTPQEAAALDGVLNDWEKRNKEVKVLEANLVRWKYDSVFATASTQPKPEKGSLKYAAPDKGMYTLEGDRPEQWLCDGNSIFEFQYPRPDNKGQMQPGRVVEHILPPEAKGRAIADGPLPFVFGNEALKLKQRFFMRIITPADAKGEIWLEAYPRLQQQASQFKKVDVILKTDGFLPYAIKIHDTNGKDSTVYQLEEVVVNRRRGWLEKDWTVVYIPFRWVKVVDQSAVQASRGMGTNR
jgi:TIGR03009 family protein